MLMKSLEMKEVRHLCSCKSNIFYLFLCIQVSSNVQFVMQILKSSPTWSVTFKFMQRNLSLKSRKETTHRKFWTAHPNLRYIRVISAVKHLNTNVTSADTSSAVIDIYRANSNAISAASRLTTPRSWMNTNKDTRRIRNYWNARIVQLCLRARRICELMNWCTSTNVRNVRKYSRQKVCLKFTRTKCTMRI